MLDLLRVRNFAIIDELEIRFEPGFNVLTGETGAGKSILVDALHLALGGRAQADCVRTGAEEAEVEALFLPRDPAASDARLLELGLPAAGAELLVRRTVQREGRSRAFVNGQLATASQLSAATRGLLDISGQHEHVGLLDAAAHIELLDAHAQLAGDRASYSEAFAQLAEAERARAQLDTDEAARAERAEWIRWQLEELKQADPKSGEDDELGQERKRLASAEKLRAGTEEAEAALSSSDGAALAQVTQAAKRLEDLSQLDPALAPLAKSVRGAAAEIDEAARELSRYAARAGGDPQRLELIDERLELLRKLSRKHGGTLASLFSRRQSMQAELSAIEDHGGELLRREAEVQKRAVIALQLANGLSQKRRAAASSFAKAVAGELAALGMAKSDLSVRFAVVLEGGISLRADGSIRHDQPLRQPGPARSPAALLDPAAGAGAVSSSEKPTVLGPRGLEIAELMLAPNVGEEQKPLARIASGGELSRVLLAVKRVLAESDPVGAYLFDEVDAGIGGAVADAVGRALAAVARGRQIICITHLPQIAVFARRHQRVEKEVARGRTRTRVTAVEGETRIEELARLLSGHVTDASLAHARELLEKAQAEAAPKRGRRAS